MSYHGDDDNPGRATKGHQRAPRGTISDKAGYHKFHNWKWLPGLVNIQKAIENGPVEIVDFPIKSGDFP